MAVYDLYGFLFNDIHGARRILEDAIGIKFDARDGDYQGGEYFQFNAGGDETFVLKVNVDPFDGEPAESLFPNHPVLFYVDDTLRSELLKEKILRSDVGFSLLRHEDLD